MPNSLLYIWRKPLKPIIIILQVLAGMAVTLLAIQVAQSNLSIGKAEKQSFELSAGRDKNGNKSMYSLFEIDDLSKIKKLSPAIKEVTIEGWGDVDSIQKGSDQYKIMNTKKIMPNYKEFAQLKILYGQYLSRKSIQNGDEAVLSLSTSKILFNTDDAVGKTFSTKNYMNQRKKYKVIGVVEDAKQDKYDRSASIYFPISKDDSRAATLLVLAKKGQVAEARKQVKNAVNKVYAKNNTFISNKKALFIRDEQRRSSNRLPPFFILAALSLSLTAIAILASQLVNVRERTREIGMKRALGATQGRIARDMLSESLVLTLIGGVLGVGVAFLSWPSLKEALSLQETFSWPLAAAVFGSLLVAALLFSLYPAMMAARLRPSEAAKAVGS